MLKGKNFIVYSDDWGRHPSSSQHLIKQYLPDNRVLWINSVGLRPPHLSSYDLGRVGEKIFEWANPFRLSEENLWIYSPFSLPWNEWSWVRRWNQNWGLNGIRKALQRLNFHDLIAITTVPNSCDWIGQLGEVLKIYYCVDDFSQWPGMEKKLILKMERNLIKRVDLIFATSDILYDSMKKFGKPVFYLPHGVDLEHFKKAYVSSEHSAKKSKFKIGYFGLINQRLDFKLLDRLTDDRPDWEFVFMGPIYFCPNKLREKKNCHFQPPVSYAGLPEALKSIDVLMLPYQMNTLTQTLNPLKLRECLATGKPVVAAPLPEIEKYAPMIAMASSKEEWIFALEESRKQQDFSRVQKCWAQLESESWKSRAETMANYIEDFLIVREKIS